MRFVLIAGATRTAEIEGISAAGADPALRAHTPSADLEIVEYGRPTRSPVVPVSPDGCPTPAVVTRAVRELVGFEVTAVDAGLARRTGAPTVSIGDRPGGDVRRADPVPDAADLFEAGRRFGRALPDERIAIGETIPGGTTTALGVLTALGERPTVSASLAENPLALKRAVVEEALAADGRSAGDFAGDPAGAVRRAGDPVLAVAAGVVVGADERGREVTLAGGTQLAAVAALARHAGANGSLTLSTTSFVAADETAAVDALAADLGVDLVATDPAFDALDHPATNAYVAGEAKEGVGMGGALALADRVGVANAEVRERIVSVYDRLVEAESGTESAETGSGAVADR